MPHDVQHTLAHRICPAVCCRFCLSQFIIFAEIGLKTRLCMCSDVPPPSSPEAFPDTEHLMLHSTASSTAVCWGAVKQHPCTGQHFTLPSACYGEPSSAGLSQASVPKAFHPYKSQLCQVRCFSTAFTRKKIPKGYAFAKTYSKNNFSDTSNPSNLVGAYVRSWGSVLSPRWV